VEDYGLLKSIRVHYRDDFEVEFGITNVQWPLDSGSRQVMRDGMQIMFERGRVFGPTNRTATRSSAG
jgi:hypothetical protein